MTDKETGPTEADMRARYDEATASVRHYKDVDRGMSAALAYAAFATSETYQNSTLFQLAATGAKYFCLAMAVIIPILLLISVA